MFQSLYLYISSLMLTIIILVPVFLIHSFVRSFIHPKYSGLASLRTHYYNPSLCGSIWSCLCHWKTRCGCGIFEAITKNNPHRTGVGDSYRTILARDRPKGPRDWYHYAARKWSTKGGHNHSALLGEHSANRYVYENCRSSICRNPTLASSTEPSKEDNNDGMQCCGYRCTTCCRLDAPRTTVVVTSKDISLNLPVSVSDLDALHYYRFSYSIFHRLQRRK